MKTMSLFLACSFLTVYAAYAETDHSLEIEVWKIGNTNGQLRVSLFDGPEGFPADYRQAHKKKVLPITNSTMKVVFDDVQFGTYAVAAHHDENGNGKVDTKFLGVPREGMGASNDASPVFGPPKYKTAAFVITGEKGSIRLRMNY